MTSVVAMVGCKIYVRGFVEVCESVEGLQADGGRFIGRSFCLYIYPSKDAWLAEILL